MVATKTSSRVRLVRFTKDAVRDSRGTPGGPLEVGQIATLSFRTEHGRGPGHKYEYVEVRVTGRSGRRFRGVVINRVMPELISPEKLSEGMELIFESRNVIGMADADGTHGGQPGAF